MASRDLALADKENTFNSDGRNQKLASQDEFVLEQVLGLTNTSTHALDCNQVTGYIAFPAAFTLVLLDPKTNDQKFIESPSVRYISSVCFSDDGRLVALGETGFKPYVAVWWLKDHKEASKFVIDHSVGVKAIVFHPKSPFLVVLGTHDCNIGVWDYVRGRRLALTKWQTAPLALTIPRPGTCVIVCGHRKITLFNTDNLTSNNYETNVFEDRKAVLLGRQSEYTFVDITSGRGKHEKEVYTVTACGFLCEIKLGDILIDKAIKVDVHAFCVRYGLGHVFVGCCEGIVKICNPETLDIVAAVSIDQLLGPEAMPKVGAKLYLDTTAIAINDKDDIITCIYADCSMHSWQINNFSDTVECSALLPASGAKSGMPSYDSSITDNMYKASLFRSFIGCCDKISGSMMFDSATLAARNRHNGRLGFMHLFKENRARYQHANAVRFSPDGRDVICGNEDGEIKVYDAASGALRRVIEAHSSQVTCIELMYDDDYQLVCSGGRDRIIFVLNAKTDFSLVQVLCDHSAAITALRLIHNGGLLTLVSAAADNVILVRRAIPGNQLKFTVIGEIAESRCNKSFNITSDYIVTGARNGNIKLFKADPVFSGKPTKTIKCTQKFNQGMQAFRAIDIDPSGSFIATTQTPGQITVYHLQTGQPIASLSSQSDVTAVKFTSDLQYMVSSTSNGCTLVWRLPERMTEFMRFKQEKIYQVEMSREISYETYVSCVRVCKETTVCDENTGTPHGLSDSNSYSNDCHACDSEVTPSIESLSLLQMCPTCHGDVDRHSMCSTESYLSCSTCSGSFSETLACDPSSDSSCQMHSAPVRLFCGSDEKIGGKIVEDAKCTKLGPFRFDNSESPTPLHVVHEKKKDLENESNPTALLNEAKLAFAIENENVKPLAQDTENLAIHAMTNVGVADAARQTGNKTTPGTKHDLKSLGYGVGDKHRSDITQAKPAEASKVQTNLAKMEKINQDAGDLNQGGEGGGGGGGGLINISENYCGGKKCSKDNSSVCDRMLFCKETAQQASTVEHIKNGKAKVAEDVPSASESASIAKQRKEVGSPRLDRKMTSPTSSQLSYKTAASPKTMNSRETAFTPDEFIFLSPLDGVISDVDDTVSPQTKNPPLVSEECQNGYTNTKSLEMNMKVRDSLDMSSLSKMSSLHTPSDISMTSFLPNVSVREAGREDSFFNELHQVCRAELEYSRAKSQGSTATPVSGGVDGGFNSAEKTTTSVLGVVKKCNSPLSKLKAAKDVLRVRQEDHLGEIKEASGESSELVPCDSKHNMVVERVDLLSDFEYIEDGDVYNYHSITRDEHGKLRRVKEISGGSHRHSTMPSPDLNSIRSAGSFTPMNNAKHKHTGSHDSTLWNIQCSRCSRRSNSKSNCADGQYNQIVGASGQDNQLAVSSGQFTPGNVSTVDTLPDNSSLNRSSNKEASYKPEDVCEDYGDVYPGELRQCLQLSNSQETFYRLSCDNHEQELKEALNALLKKNPAHFSDILTLAPSQMELLRSRVTDTESEDRYSKEKDDTSSLEKSSSTLCSIKMPSGSEVAKKMTSLQWNNSSASRVSGASESQYNLAKKILSFVESILTGGKTGSRFRVIDRVLCTRKLASLLSSTAFSSSSSGDSLETSKKEVWDYRKHIISTQGYNKAHAIHNSYRPSTNTKLNHILATKQLLDTEVSNVDKGDGQHAEVLFEKAEAKPEMPTKADEINPPVTGEVSNFETNSFLYKSRFGKLCSYKTPASKWSADTDIKHPFRRSMSVGRDGPGSRPVSRPEGSSQGHTAPVEMSPASIRKCKLYHLDKEGEGTQASERQNPHITSIGCSGENGVGSSAKPGGAEGKSTPPIVELIRDQDDYLKKLKEVREKFERSIQALSDERKSRLVEEDTKYHLCK